MFVENISNQIKRKKEDVLLELDDLVVGDGRFWASEHIAHIRSILSAMEVQDGTRTGTRRTCETLAETAREDAREQAEDGASDR